MNQPVSKLSSRRRPWLAVLLSLIIVGLGQVYCGRITKGLFLFLIGNVLGVVFTVTVLLKQTFWSPYVLIAWFLTLNAVWLFAVFDAWLLARRTEPGYVLRDYNRWYVYLILTLLWLPSSFNYAILIREGLFEAFCVAANSMAPTLARDDRVLADKLVYRTEPVRRADVVVLLNPNNRHQRWVKRVVALAGESVEIRGGRLMVNGDPLPRAPSGPKTGSSPPTGKTFVEENGDVAYSIFACDEDQATAECDFPATTIPPGHCFVLGDNRNNSRDGRHVGPTPLVDIVGRVDLVYFPRFRRLRD